MALDKWFDEVTLPNASFYKGQDAGGAETQLLGVTGGDIVLLGDVSGNGLVTNIQADGTTGLSVQPTGDVNVDNGALNINADGNAVAWGAGQDAALAYESTPDVLDLTGKDLRFSALTGTPTMGGHDHSEGGLTAVQAVGTDVIGTNELDLSITPTWTGEHTFDAGFVSGTFETTTNPGNITFIDAPVDSTPAAGTEESYAFAVDGTDILTIYAEADGSGGIQNQAVRANQIVDVNGNDIEDSGTTIWDTSAGEIPDGAMGAIDAATLNTPYSNLNTLFGDPTVVGAELRIQDGTAASPSVSLSNITNTGILRGANNGIAISEAGTEVFEAEQDGIRNKERILMIDGSSAVPALSFSNDGNTGLYRDGADSMRATIGGTDTVEWTSGQVNFFETVNFGSHQIDGITSAVLSGDLDVADGQGVLFGNSDDMKVRYDAGSDSMNWGDTGASDRMELDRTTGNLNIEGSLTEGAAL